MKRITTLLLSAAMVFGAASAASAVDVKVKGQFDFAFGWADNLGFHDKKDFHRNKGGEGNDHFYADQRVRTQVNFIASENLQGVLMFEIGTISWGRGGSVGRSSGGALDADGVNIETKRAYIDWIIPDTDVAVRMGIQGLALPSATDFGSPIFNADVAAVTVSTQFTDMFGATAFWARPFDAYEHDGKKDSNGNFASKSRLRDETDMFGLILPVTGEGWSFTPYAVYAQVGHGSGFHKYLFGTDAPSEKRDSEVHWFGAAFELTVFDPLTFAMDGAYGNMTKGDFYAARGWFLDARVDYKLDWGVPGLFGWYSSGDDKNDVKKDKQLGRIPVLGVDGGFSPTSFGYAGSFSIGQDGVVSNSGMGTWGVGAQIADMSFVENLTHTLRFAYYEGNNDRRIKRDDIAQLNYNGDNIYMTTKDHAWEINFDHKYQIYENLAAVLELGYINANLYNEKGEDDAWKAQVLFQYKF